MVETEFFKNRRPQSGGGSVGKKKNPEKKPLEAKEPSDTEACFLASSESLADWNRPEEDEAWKDL